MNDHPRILVVEGDTYILHQLAMTLCEAGYAVLEASTGAEGLEIVREQLPDLVLLDVILPDSTGIQICYQIKTNLHLKNTFVLLLTGDRIEGEEQARVFESGADGYLIRSIPNNVLLARVESLFRTKHTLDALRESEEQYRLLVENVSEVIYSIGRDFIILDVSSSVERLLGYKPEELKGKPFNELNIVSEEYLEVALSDSMRVFSGDRITGCVYEFISRDGRRRFGEVSGSPLVRDGQVVALVSVARDITDRKQAEQAVQKRNEELAAFNSIATVANQSLDLIEVLNSTMDCALDVLGNKGGVIYLLDQVNQVFLPAIHRGISEEAIQQVTGFRINQGLSGRVVETGEPLVVPDLGKDPRNISPAAAREGWRSYAGVPIQAKGRILGVLVLISRQKGYFKEDHINLLKYIGSQIGMAVENAQLYQKVQQELISREQTEETLRLSEARYRAIVDDQTELICRYKPDGTLTFVNQTYCQYFNTTEDQLIGTGFIPTAAGDQADRLRAYLASFSAANPVNSIAQWDRDADGQIRWRQWTDRAILDSQGNIIELQAVGRDVTKHKLAEQALQDSEMRYRNIFDSAAVAIWEEDFSAARIAIDELKAQGIVDFDRHFNDHPDFVEKIAHLIKVVDINQQTLKMYKAQSKDEMLASLDQVIVPETMQIIKEELIAFAEDRRYFSGETINKTLHGERLNVLLTMSLPEPGLSYNNVLVCIMDITERERAKEALLESEQRYQELFERMSSGVAVYGAIDDGADFVLKDFNIAGERIEHIDRKKILGKRVTEAFPGVKALGLFDVFKRVWKTGNAEFLPPAQYFDERSPGGWRENWVYRLPSGEIVAIYNDVTERKQNELAIKENEARYRSLFQDSPIVLWEEDFSEIKKSLDQLREGGVTDFRRYFANHPESVYDSVSKVKILDLNASALELHEAESKEYLLCNLHEIFCEESYDTFLEELINIAEGLRIFDLEATIRTVQGEKKQTLIRWTTAPGSEDSLKRVYISVTDITQLKQIEDRLKASLAEKEVLLREVHHRVKNNLEVIASLANMQFSAIQEPTAKQSIRELEERIRTFALVHENLYQSANLSQVRTRSYLMKLTDNLIQAFSPGGVDLILELSDIPLNIDTAIPCGLIVTELVTNAFKYAFPNGWKPREGHMNYEIHVKLWMEEKMVNLEVSDNGIGQSPEFNWRTARTLGLRLVNRLVTQLHGTLTVEIECGTKYRLVFAHPEGAAHG